MRCSQRKLFQQRGIDGRLPFPDIEHDGQSPPFSEEAVEHGVIHNGATRCIDEDGTRFEPLQECLVDQMKGWMPAFPCQWHMDANDVGLQYFVQPDKRLVTALLFQGRIIHPALDAQGREFLKHP